jgi:hypothetical protein
VPHDLDTLKKLDDLTVIVRAVNYAQKLDIPPQQEKRAARKLLGSYDSIMPLYRGRA